MKRPASEGGGPAKKRKCGYCGDEGGSMTKPTKLPVHPAKTLISLHIYAV